MARGGNSRKATVKRGGTPSRSDTAPSSLPAVLFDLDGTLIDSVYQHTLAWFRALASAGIVLPVWKIHRRIGMSGSSFLRELLREVDPDRHLTRKQFDRLDEQHTAEFAGARVEVLSGSCELLNHLEKKNILWAIATTGGKEQTKRLIELLPLPEHVPVVTGDDIRRAKPSPDAFVEAARRLRVPIEDCIAIGDSVWDLLAAGRKSALGVGVLTGGYSRDELERAGAFRVYCDPADLLAHIEDLGLPGE